MKKVTFKKRLLNLSLITLFFFTGFGISNAQEPMLGEIKMFAGTYAPRGWAFCDGQLLSISQNTALFSILGTTYGGDGRTTFALPDLRGRVPMGPRRGNGSNYDWRLGQKTGVELKTLSPNELPSHSHTFNANSELGELSAPANGSTSLSASADGRSAGQSIYNTKAPNVQMKSGSIGNTGGNSSFPMYQPSLAINYIICTVGIFPSRN